MGRLLHPKRQQALINVANTYDEHPQLLKSVVHVNNLQPLRLLELLKKHINDLKGKTIGVLGITFKPDTDDIRGSRSIPIIEKPSPKKAPSNLACAGIYVFAPTIFEAIEHTEPDHNNEYQLTDSIKWMINHRKAVFYKILEGQHIDIGTPERLKMANKFLTQII